MLRPRSFLVAFSVPFCAFALSSVSSPRAAVAAKRIAADREANIHILKQAASAVCNQFPGSMCNSLIRGARVRDPATGFGAERNLHLQRALRQKMDAGLPFVFAAFGSSVTSGHDNHANTSWPFELERLLKPIFKKVGFGFELRQRGVGGYNEAPFSAGCLRNRAGSGVDAVSWEWGMFEDSKCVVENFAREAYSLNGAFSPPPTIMSIEGTVTNIKILRSGVSDVQATLLRNEVFTYKDLEYALVKNRRWQPNKWYLTDDFIPEEELREFRSKIRSNHGSFLMKSNKSEELSATYSAQYENVTGMKPTKAQQASMDATADALANKNIPTPHMIKSGAMDPFLEAGYPYEAFFTTAGIEDVPHAWRSWYVAREKAFNINWHPGPLGHLLIASQLAHFILEQAQLALKHEVSEMPYLMTPSPRQECGAGTSMSCATGMQPHNGHDIKDVVSPGMQYRGGYQYGTSLNQVGGADNYDKRQVLTIHGGSAPLVLSVEATRVGDVAVVCMAPCPMEGCRAHQGYVGAGNSRFWRAQPKPKFSDVEYSLDGKVVQNSELLFMNEKVFGEKGSFCANCTVYTEVCQAVAELKGAHELSLKVKPRTGSPFDPTMYVEILQLMVVPGPLSVKGLLLPDSISSDSSFKDASSSRSEYSESESS